MTAPLNKKLVKEGLKTYIDIIKRILKQEEGFFVS